MKNKKFLKPVDKKYEQIFKVWNEPRIDYKVNKSNSNTNWFIKILLHPLTILTIISIGMVIYTFDKCLGR